MTNQEGSVQHKRTSSASRRWEIYVGTGLCVSLVAIGWFFTIGRGLLQTFSHGASEAFGQMRGTAQQIKGEADVSDVRERLQEAATSLQQTKTTVEQTQTTQTELIHDLKERIESKQYE